MKTFIITLAYYLFTLVPLGTTPQASLNIDAYEAIVPSSIFDNKEETN